MEMKIVLVSSCFGTYGGIEAFVLALAKSLLESRDCDPKVVWKQAGDFRLTEQLEAQSRESQVPFDFVPPRSRALWKEIRDADVVHAQNSPPDAVLFSKLQRKPLVLTVHNRRMKEHRWKSIGWSVLQRLADRRWYNSNFVRHTWEGEKTREGTRVIPTVSDLPHGDVPIPRRKGFCFASRWIPNKGMDVLLEAYETGKFNPHDWPLHMMGDGPLYRSLRDRYEKSLGIYFHGFVSEEEKADRVRNTRWMVVPPHTQEDLGLTAIEARNVGVPCVVTRDGGLPEAAGESAIFCEPGNVDSLLDGLRFATRMSEEEYEQRARNSKKSLDQFLMPLSEYPKLYQEIRK
jgi:glycosyltransferase involved in cell wall biosynthesis